MNKYQEALGFLKESAYENYLSKYVQTSKEKVTLFKSSEYLQELVDKATPKKPKIRAFNEAEPWYCADYLVEREACPLCGRKLLDKDPYCYICGQAIDWSNE